MAVSTSIAERLNLARRDVLDLGLRNTLLNYRLTKSRGVQLVENRAEDVLRWLVREQRSLQFVAAKQPDLLEGAGSAAQGVRDKVALYTAHDEKALQARLLATYYAARTHIEERGVNILFVAIGMLHWFEDESSDKELRAPILLVPVELKRTSARERFTISYNEEDIEGNLSLATKLRADFGIECPEMPDVEELDVYGHMRRVARSVAGQARWRVEPDELALGFFSFAKFLMYRDLDASHWCTKENPDGTPVLAAMIRDGFRNEPATISDEAYLDKVMAPDALSQVVDMDSSQALAMFDVCAGRNLVIQGPPGTGKSQTITNLIADALGRGKRVLFVAEKMAALEVVKRRLDQVGVGDACLEIHSHAANKKSVLAELQRTVQLGKPRVDTVSWDAQHYKSARDQLNAYCLAVNTPVGGSGLTPHDLMGELIAVSASLSGTALPRPSFETKGDSEQKTQILAWSRSQIQEKEIHVANLQALLASMGMPCEHPFRTARIGSLLPSDREQIAEALGACLECVQTLESVMRSLSNFMGIVARSNRADAEMLARAGRRALMAPHLQGVKLRTGDWQSKRDQLRQLLEAGARYTEIRQEHAEILISDAWDQDMLKTREVLNTVGRKWWRWVSSDFRHARRHVAGLCRGDYPKDVDSQLRLADAVIEAARLRRVVHEYRALARALYGVQWQELESDWAVLRRLTDWVITLYRDLGDGHLPPGIIEFLSGSPALDALEGKIKLVETSLSGHDKSFLSVCERLALDEAAASTIRAEEVPAQTVKLQMMRDRIGELQYVITFNHLKAILEKEGLSWVVDAAWDWRNASASLVHFFRRTCFETLLRKAYAEREALKGFDATSHENTRERFKSLDVTSLKATQMRLAAQHWANRPTLNNSGQLGILLREFEKRSRHLPIRKLVVQAGNAIQAIKPVFMMSPMSIAAFIPPQSVRFDLVIFDEASQVRPVDAFGAVLRGQQLVVVGDSKQLPPTSFFDALVGDDNLEEEEENVTSDIESVLGLMASQGAPQRMLRWHYRSRHQSLIAVSNREFYDNRLVVFPSPYPARRELGLVFHHLPNTEYDRGRSRTNQKEAEMVAKAVMAHAKTSPHLTLGVAAFSLQQAEAIIDQLELLRRGDPSVEGFFSAHQFEPFFVKNLESVQGDERDVIFISIGYGRDAHGYVSMVFGPLNWPGGERRLNVLITRARQCCEVFTNLTHDDIDLTRTPARGVAALKAFLKYAQVRIIDVPDTGGQEEDSPFEREVAESLRRAGHDVALQVGSGGFRIDLAVRDPEKPGRYLLGIECDGATYHRSRSSRDRDRLRQQVLENLGWQLHRVWSTDWFSHPERELRRTTDAIERARIRGKQPSTKPKQSQSPAANQPPLPAVPRLASDPEPVIQELSGKPYVICNLKINRGHLDLHEIPAHRFSSWIDEVVGIEGPIHKDEVARRIADAAGVKRLGNRIEAAFDRGLRDAVQAKVVRQRKHFLWPVKMTRPTIRDRSSLPVSSRRIDLIAPEEITEAICLVVQGAYGINLEDISQAVCRVFGFGRTSEEMSSTITDIATNLCKTGVLAIRDDHITIGSAPSSTD